MRPPRIRQVHVLLVWRRVVWGVKGGGSLPVRRHSYVRHGVEGLITLKNDKKRLEVKPSRQTPVYLGFVSGTNRYNAF